MTAGNLPTAIGRYTVIERLGHGGMGTVYRALDPQIGRTVAVKVLRVADEALYERFVQEARSAGRLSHRNIVTIHDFGEHEGRPFIVMEFVEGHTLAALIGGATDVPIERRLGIIAELGHGLAYAHSRGIIHRDIKPANVMVTADGVLKILDFGIARVTESGLTKTGALVGTPNYMSPEQIEGRAIDQRSDLFALGTVAYEVIANRQAFPGDSLLTVMTAILSSMPTPLTELCPDLDPGIAAIVNRAMAKKPDARQATVAEFVSELERSMSDLGLSETRPGASSLPRLPTGAPAGTPRPRSSGESARDRKTAQVEAQVRQASLHLAAGEYTLAVESAALAVFTDPNHEGARKVLENARDAHARHLEARDKEPDLGKTEIISHDAPSALPPTQPPVVLPLSAHGAAGAPPTTDRPAPVARAPLPAPVSSAPAVRRSAGGAALAAALVVVVLGGGLAWYLLQPGTAEPTTPSAPSLQVSTLPSTIPAEPVAGPAPALRPPVEPAADPALDGSIGSARARLRAGDAAGAAKALGPALSKMPADQTVAALRAEILRLVEGPATDVRRQADATATRHPLRYAEAQAAYEGAGSADRQGRLDLAVERFLSATRLYRRSIDEAPTVQTQRPAAAVQPAPTIVATTTVPAAAPPPPTSAPTSSVPAISLDEISDLLARYGAAYGSFNVGAVERLYPSLPDQEREVIAALRKNHRSCSFSYNGLRVLSSTANEVSAVADVVRACQANNNQNRPPDRRRQQFDLRRTPQSGWLIVQVLEGGR